MSPTLAPVVLGDRAFIVVSLSTTAVRSAPADAPLALGPVRARLAGTGQTGADALVAADPAGPVAGWILPLPSGAWADTLLAASDGTIIVSASAGDARLVFATDPSRAASPP